LIRLKRHPHHKRWNVRQFIDELVQKGKKGRMGEWEKG
jgi:hypothetical protein